MNHTSEAPRTLGANQEAEAADLYRVVHRGLRWGLSHALLALGAVDLNDSDARSDVLTEVATIVSLCGLHVRHEADFVHEAIGRVSPSLLATLDHEHDDHFSQIADLTRRATVLRHGGSQEQEALRQDLYLRLGSFFAENLEHMRREEEVVQPLLSAHYSTAELADIHMRIVQAIPFDELVSFLRVMLPAITVQERLALLSGPKAAMPQQVFAALLWQASTHLTLRDRAVLVERLDEAA